MAIFRSNTFLDSYKTRPAVHYIPSRSNATAFGMPFPSGLELQALCVFEKATLKMIK